jgi:methylmalonyl-CoA mutase C-terminal domain/subunit
MIVNAAIQEDVDLIGLSILSGAHVHLVDATMKELAKNKVKGKKVFVGGIVPEEDIKKLKKMGVRDVFTPGTPLKEIIETLEKS